MPYNFAILSTTSSIPNEPSGLLNTLFVCVFFIDVAGSIQNVPLLEDLLLREFPPIVPALQALQFGSDVALSSIQQVYI